MTRAGDLRRNMTPAVLLNGRALPLNPVWGTTAPHQQSSRGRLLSEMSDRFTPTHRVPPLRGVRTTTDVVTALSVADRMLDGGSPQADNVARASYAAAAVKAYGDAVGTAKHEEIRLVMQDMLGDLRHLCDAVASLDGEYPTDFDQLVEGGRLNYVDEVLGHTS